MAVAYLELHFKKENMDWGKFPAPYTTSQLVCIASKGEGKGKQRESSPQKQRYIVFLLSVVLFISINSFGGSCLVLEMSTKEISALIVVVTAPKKYI